MPRFPQSLAGRFALLLVVALLAANAAAVMLLAADRAHFRQALKDARDFGHVIDAIEAIRDASPDDRRHVARALSNAFLDARVSRRPAVTRTPPRYRALVSRIESAIGASGTIDVANRPTTRRRDRRGPPRDGRDGRDERDERDERDGREPPDDDDWHMAPRGGPPSSQAVWITMTFQNADFLNVRLGPLGPLPRAPFLGPLLLFMGLSLLAVLGVGLWFVRRLTRPIRSLSDAASRAGRGDYTTRVPETGPRELREMAAAFNDMQTRIARFDQDRMRLIGAVGHDLRTPITSLRIRAEMLDDEMRDPMVRTLDEMHVMADGLLAFAKGEAAEASEVLDFAALVERVCAETDTPVVAEARPKVLGRPVALSRLVMNLLTNAERYGGGGAARLRVDAGRAVFTVTDEGPGIPEDRLEEMMEPFNRLDDSRSTDTGGAGLGLSIARSVARGHGGELTIANGPEGGLVARVELPLATEYR